MSNLGKLIFYSPIHVILSRAVISALRFVAWPREIELAHDLYADMTLETSDFMWNCILPTQNKRLRILRWLNIKEIIQALISTRKRVSLASKSEPR